MKFATFDERVSMIIRERGPSSIHGVVKALLDSGAPYSKRHVSRTLDKLFEPPITSLDMVTSGLGQPLHQTVLPALEGHIRTLRSQRLLIAQLRSLDGANLLIANDRRGERWWVPLNGPILSLKNALSRLRDLVGKDIAVIPTGELHAKLNHDALPLGVSILDYAHPPGEYQPPEPASELTESQHTHLRSLEEESIRIIREAVAVSRNPAMLFSMGKDSMVMLTLAIKAFWPDPVPFPLVMIDTRWKFQDMYRFRHWIETRPHLDVRVHINPDAIRDNINPFDHGSAHHTDITKTQALRQILDTQQFDFVFGGARRDEEKSRAKERVFSLRNSNHGWDPKNQRPELWNLYNTRLAKGQSMRVFPISNWTELDIWRYVEQENIPVVPLYFSEIRPFVERNRSLVMVDDDRFPLEPGEKIHFEPIRFRTLGCYPLTGGVRSKAKTVSDIINELEHARVSERSSRVIDFDAGASMEQKKREGYF